MNSENEIEEPIWEAQSAEETHSSPQPLSENPWSQAKQSKSGFPLALMFLLTAIFAILIAAATPLTQPQDGTPVNWTILGTSIGLGLVFGVGFGIVYGLHSHRFFRGMFFGTIAGITVGIFGPPLAFLTAGQLGSTFVSVTIGSLLLVAFAGLIRLSESKRTG